MPSKVIHLSDLHIKADANDEENLNFTILKSKILDKYKDDDPKPMILITGDIVDNGEKKEQCKKANELFLDFYSEGYTVWSIPGNHEYGWGGIVRENKLQNFKKEIIKKNNERSLSKETSYPLGKYFFSHYFIAIDSLLKSPKWPPYFEYGKLITKQIDIIKTSLTAAKNENPEGKRIVFLHSHPFNFYRLKTITYKQKELLEILPLFGWRDFMESISGLADVLLFGHNHYFVNFSKSSVAKKYDIPCILSCGKSTAGQDGSPGSREFEIKNDVLDLGSRGTANMYGWEIVLNDKITVNPLTH